MNRLDMRRRVEAATSTKLLELYELVGNVTTVVHGVNWTLSIDDTSGTTYFVRLYRVGRSVDEVAAELSVLNAIASSAALDVARPKLDCLGRSFSEIELPDGSRRLLAVFQQAVGRELADTLDDFRHAGLALAHLHRQSQISELAPAREIVSERLGLETIAMVEKRCSLVADIFKDTLEQLGNRGANTGLGHIGFCHGDLRKENMRIDGERVTLFDFDDCGRGPQLFDVAAMAFWLETAGTENAPQLWRAFLKGYGQASGEAIVQPVCWLVVNQQLRTLKFLFDYCELEPRLWDVALNDAADLVKCAARFDLRVFRCTTA